MSDFTDDAERDYGDAVAEGRHDPILFSKVWTIVKNVSRYPDGSYDSQAVGEIIDLTTEAKREVLGELMSWFKEQPAPARFDWFEAVSYLRASKHLKKPYVIFKNSVKKIK